MLLSHGSSLETKILNTRKRYIYLSSFSQLGPWPRINEFKNNRVGRLKIPS